MKKQTREQQIVERFAEDTSTHKLTVLHDDGLYRHIRLRQPNRNTYWFDLITTPGTLTIRGDCGTFVFSRIDDMFQFFRGKRINPHYWAQKEQSGARTQEYSEEAFKRWVWSYVREHGQEFRGLAKAVQTEIFEQLEGELHVEEHAREVLDSFWFREDPNHPFIFEFANSWEISFRDWDWQFLWCCHAIVLGIQQYDTYRLNQRKRRVRKFLAHPGRSAR